MKLLKKELQSLTQLAERSDWETPEQFVEALAAELDKVRAERVTYFAVMRFGSNGTVFMQGVGPFSTKGQAVKAIEKHPAAGMATAYAVVPCVNDDGLDELIAKIDAPPVSRGDYAEVRKDAAATKNGWDGKARKREAYLS